MNLYEALAAENGDLMRATRKLVDSTLTGPQVREDLLAEIAARLDAQEAVRENHVYPILRLSAGRGDLVEQYHARVSSLRGRIQELRDLPRDSNEPFQCLAEFLHDDIESMTHWEDHEAMPAVRDVLTDDEAADLGEWVRAEQKTVLGKFQV